MASYIAIENLTTLPTAPNVIQLTGDGTPYSGSGTPWDSASSPYQLSMNDVTGGIFTPQTPVRTDVLSGAPPFAIGSDVIYRGYGNTTFELGVQMYATSYEYAVDLLNRLRLLLSTRTRLRVQPNGASHIQYFYVDGATVQETSRFINEEAGVATRIIRALVTLSVKAFGTPNALETLNNAASMSNAGTGSPTNLLAYGAGTGELIYEGSPLAMYIATSAQQTRMYLATALARTYDTTGAATLTTSSTSGATANLGAPTVSDYRWYPGLRFGLFVHASVASNAQFRIEILLSTTTAQPIYTSPWISSTAAVAQLIYAGSIDLSVFDAGNTANAQIRIRYRSTNGSSASVVLTSMQYLYYYDLAIINPDYTNGITSRMVFATGMFYSGPQRGRPTSAHAWSYTLSTDTVPSDALEIRGQLPRYRAGCSLFCAYLTGSTGLYTTSNTMTATIYHGPLYHTLRGGAL